MAKPNIPNQKKKYQELNSRLNRYVALVEQIYDTLNLEAAKIALNTEYDAIFELGFHQHYVCSHFQKLLIFLRMVHIINHPVDGYFRLFLLYLSVIAYHSPTLVRMP